MNAGLIACFGKQKKRSGSDIFFVLVPNEWMVDGQLGTCVVSLPQVKLSLFESLHFISFLALLRRFLALLETQLKYLW